MEDSTGSLATDISNTAAIPEVPSPAEMRNLRKQFVTKQHPTVVGCGHRLDLTRQPVHRNCETCWFAWFQNNGKVTQQCDEMFQADGGVMIEQLQGKKFLHNFRKFMATLAEWKRQQESQELMEKQEHEQTS